MHTGPRHLLTPTILPVAILLCGVFSSAQAQSPDIQSNIDTSRRNALVQAIEKSSPAVVSINVVQVQRERVLDPFYRDFFEFFGGVAPRYRLREREIQSVGSGFIFDNQGHILTNYHVIEGAAGIASVTLPDGRVIDVKLVGVDPLTDLAVLQATETPLPYIPLGDSDNLLIGEWVIAIGNPFGMLMNDPQPSVSVGVVSANHRRVRAEIAHGQRLYQNLIQTDAAINPGNSGGPLVNAHGTVVGVNTMIFSQSGGSVGLGFAIPINRAKRVAEEIIQHGRRRNPWAGFKVHELRDIDPNVLQRLGVRATAGTIVVSIVEGCPAHQAGLQAGDVITSINGQPVRQAQDVDFVIWGLFIGDRVKLEVQRGNQTLLIEFLIVELNNPEAQMS
ncbi:MAG: trypsin-like peptidase domain-containing protein [FCB group bacterium]|jgi:serine protease Do|nr:trypsin-like peptidase domain-containing protein [FCB group bacterium]